MATNKKVTRVGNSTTKSTTTNGPVIDKGQAKIYRLIAIITWVVAIGMEVWAILLLRNKPINMTTLIILIVIALILSITGSFLWKKANKLDPASEKDKFKFFIQNQLGAIMGVITFLPLVILIFTNKNLDKKQKGILGGIATAALIAAGLLGADFNPPSQEQYEEQRQEIQNEITENLVYWTKHGKSYHLYDDCSYINTHRTDELFAGSIAEAKEHKNITDICNRCEARSIKESEASLTGDILDEEGMSTEE